MAFPFVVHAVIKRPAALFRLQVVRKYGNNMCRGMFRIVASRLLSRLAAPFLLILFSLFLSGMSGEARAWSWGNEQIPVVDHNDLPIEARRTIVLIRQGGPFPWPKDGSVFGNYEGVLPKRKRGYYHEFTVNTPGIRGRGARRIIVGGNWQTSRELYYTANHYASFSRIKE